MTKPDKPDDTTLRLDTKRVYLTPNIGGEKGNHHNHQPIMTYQTHHHKNNCSWLQSHQYATVKLSVTSEDHHQQSSTIRTYH